MRITDRIKRFDRDMACRRTWADRGGAARRRKGSISSWFFLEDIIRPLDEAQDRRMH